VTIIVAGVARTPRFFVSGGKEWMPEPRHPDIIMECKGRKKDFGRAPRHFFEAPNLTLQHIVRTTGFPAGQRD
jgi:hypothetical protein